MNKKNYIALSASLLALVGVFAVAPAAQSQGFADLLRNALDGNRGYNQSYNNPSPHQIQTMVNLNANRVNLENKIALALANGDISPAQANSWRAQLYSNADLQRSYTNGGGLTFAEAQTLISTLSRVDVALQSAISVSPTNQAVWTTTTTRGYYGNRSHRSDRRRGDFNNFGNINRMQRQLLSRLQQGRADRHLTDREYYHLMRQYRSIVTFEDESRNNRGQLSSQERARLLDRLRSLEATITQQMYNRRISHR